MKKVKVLRDITLSDGITYFGGSIYSFDNGLAEEQEAKGNVKILQVPENRTKKEKK